nr:reverse transcriptase domain-containing protein [Tanacetum cinerariifolium]
MHTRASNSELVELLPERERTLNRRLHRQNKRVPFNQRNNLPQHPRIVYPPILNINYFCHFLDILQNYDPMDDEPMWAADRVVALTPGSTITIPETANKFSINGNHLTFIKGNQFDGRTKNDPHKHIHEFLKICDMFKYRDTENEAVRLMMFPISLTREAKTWLDKLNEGTIKTLLESQILDKNKEGLGYSVVSPPPAQLYSSPKKDLSWTGLHEFKDDTDFSWTGLPEFKDDTVTDYSRSAPTVESSPDDAQNKNSSVTKEASPSTISPKSFIKFVKANDSPTKSKIDKAEKAKKSPVKKRVKKGTSRSQNNTHKSFISRHDVHKPYRPPMRPV